MLGGEADDVVQEVFARFWSHPPVHGQFIPWLYRTSTNACLDRLRSVARRDSMDWQAEVGQHYFDNCESHSRGEHFLSKDLCRRLILRADARTQEVVALVFFDDMTYDEAAKVLGISRKTIGERIERFVTLARKVLHQWQPQ